MRKAQSDKIRNHTTVIDAAEPIVRHAVSLEAVDRVTPGFIKTGIKKLRSHQAKVKLTHQDGCVLLQIRGNISVQEVRVYTKDTQSVLEAISRYALDEGYRIEYGHDEVAERRRTERKQEKETPQRTAGRRKMR